MPWSISNAVEFKVTMHSNLKLSNITSNSSKVQLRSEKEHEQPFKQQIFKSAILCIAHTPDNLNLACARSIHN